MGDNTIGRLTPMTWFVILAVVTSVLALGLPPDPQTLHQLHITSEVYRIAIVVLLVPYGIIWYAAFYAFAKLKEYTSAIKGFEDGNAFHSITTGMGVLAFGLVLPTAIDLILNDIAMHHHGFTPASVIIDNYMGVVVALVSFLFINHGTNLLTLLNKRRPTLNGIWLFGLLFIALASIFTYLVISYHAKHDHVYYLNTFLLITTFIIPALFAWFVAILSAYEFGIYAKFAKGMVYRRMLRQFSYGIVIAIFASVASEFADNTFAAKVSHSLGYTLLAEYALLIILGAGLVLMALGAKQLKKIEDI